MASATQTIAPKYQCGHCLYLHDDEDDAEECCRPTVSTVYCCPECDAHFKTEQEAIECCDPDTLEAKAQATGREFPKEAASTNDYVREFLTLNHLAH